MSSLSFARGRLYVLRCVLCSFYLQSWFFCYRMWLGTLFLCVLFHAVYIICFISILRWWCRVSWRFHTAPCDVGEDVLCGMRNAEFSEGVFCGIFVAEKNCGIRCMGRVKMTETIQWLRTLNNWQNTALWWTNLQKTYSARFSIEFVIQRLNKWSFRSKIVKIRHHSL